jgi:hypothetical protein
MANLTREQTLSVKKSYFNILGLLLDTEKIESRYVRCLLKWGFQLQLTPEDLERAEINIADLQFSDPGKKIERIESIYHLVYMIFLDDVVEDVELEIATVYAGKLGFKETLVSELFRSIATADYDNTNPSNVRQQVIDFLKVYEP